MDSELRAKLRRQIQAYMEKNPSAEPRKVRYWLLEDNNVLKDIQVNPRTIKSFVIYQVTKFKNGSDVTKYLGGNGRPSISKQKKNQILRLSLNNENMGLRPVALKVGVSYNTVRSYAAPAVNELYPDGSACWQDDPASIHRCQAAITAVSECFNKRLDHFKQCPKFSDVWPIENVWGIVKDRVSKKKCENLGQLKREITKVWRSINAD